jgi:hypothetical protein
MAEPTDLSVVRGSKKKQCPFCGAPEHTTTLACPRVQGVHFSPDGEIAGVEFRDGFEFPDDAA